MPTLVLTIEEDGKPVGTLTSRVLRPFEGAPGRVTRELVLDRPGAEPERYEMVGVKNDLRGVALAYESLVCFAEGRREALEAPRQPDEGLRKPDWRGAV